MRGLIAISLCAAVAASPSFSLALEECDQFHNRTAGNIHGWIISHVDQGNGLISFGQVVRDSDDGSVWTSLELVACGTGEVVSVEYYYSPGADTQAEMFDLREVVYVELDGMIASDEIFNLQDVADRFSEVSSQVSMNLMDEQPCGCRAAYPLHGNYEYRFDQARLSN